MKNKLKVIIFAAAVAAATGLFVVITIFTGFRFNDASAVGNTNGNLYNGGLFCESGGYIYFANPYDGYSLYRMKSGGGKVSKLVDDNVAYINVYKGYLYYRRRNSGDIANSILQGNPHGIYRAGIRGNGVTELYRGVTDNLTLSGNYLYFRSLNNNDVYNLKKIRIDGKKSSIVVTKEYVPGCLYDKKIYFAETEGNHNLYVMDTADDNIKLKMEGNIYLPDIYDGWLYYIDCDNSRALTRRKLNGGDTEVLGEDRVINYNLSGKHGVIYYQAENGANHALMRMNPDGSMREEIIAGDYANISVTSKYTYFYRVIGEEKSLYRTPTKGDPAPEPYEFAVDKK